MDDEVVPSFSNPQEEITFWKKKYFDKVTEFKELEESFEDFQDSSRELEKEMEKDLERSEKRLAEINSQYHKLKNDHDLAMEKSRRVADDSGSMIHHLQDELETLKKNHRESQKIQQKLEQDNDVLERREREHSATIQDLTEKVNKLLEDNAWLQTELEDYRQKYLEATQRSKEEIRDLKLELELSEKAPNRRHSMPPHLLSQLMAEQQQQLQEGSSPENGTENSSNSTENNNNANHPSPISNNNNNNQSPNRDHDNNNNNNNINTMESPRIRGSNRKSQSFAVRGSGNSVSNPSTPLGHHKLLPRLSLNGLSSSSVGSSPAATTATTPSGSYSSRSKTLGGGSLNLVNDMLQLVKDMESRLNSNKQFESVRQKGRSRSNTVGVS